MSELKIIMGLGNPGPRYQNTRHNAGFMALALLVTQNGLEDPSRFGQSLVSRGRLGGQRLIMAWPQTYMNLSGLAARELLSFYKLTGSDLLVIHDEMDLPLGRIKFSKGGGNAGHNGLGSLMDEISEPFDRLKIGIGRPQAGSFHIGAADYVLDTFNSMEGKIIDEALEKAAKVAAIWAVDGLEAAQRVANRKVKEKKKLESKTLDDNGNICG